MSILVVGSVAFDSVKTSWGSVSKILGGSAAYFSVAASYFSDVNLVAVVGDDFSDEHLEVLTAKGVDVRGLERVRGRTFAYGCEYAEDMNQRTSLYTHLNVFADFSPKVHPDYTKSKHLFLGNIDPRLQREVVDQIQRPRLVACDTMNYWISGSRGSLLETLKLVDILMINDEECQQLAEERHLLKAARQVLKLGPRRLVVKRGAHGALLLSDADAFWTPAYLVEEVRDPTGAGDAFAGGFMGYLASVGQYDETHVRRAMVFGAVMASFTVERFGLDRLRELTFPEIAGRFREFKRLTEFEDLQP